ncbi:hypothetical protein [Streptomyces sp. NPDC002588]|uniref:hypothetical protein n=1 Tax=Streptomyces sp. NPDC002588 TaxID=3154419 RepID=UPI0033268C37
MNASIVLSVVLGLGLLGVVAVLTRRTPRLSPGRVPAAGRRADRKALETVALGLRAVAEGREHGTRPLPDVHAVLHSERRMTLLLAGADAPAPAPWAADVSGKEWWVDPANLRRAGNGSAGPTHPYSLTVTLGHHGGDRVLVDLSRLPGAIALTGDDNDVLQLAQALINEIVSGPVGVLAVVVLVGSAAGPSVTDGLDTRSARLHTAPTRGEALTRGDSARPGADTGASAHRTLHFRTGGGGGAASTGTHARRLFVVTAAQFRDERWSDTPLRESDALLVLGYVPDADWRFEVNADGSLDTGRLGLPVDRHTAGSA